MIDPFFIAATGLLAQERQVATIANNVANWNTPAYKKSRVEFEDLMYRELAAATGLIGNPDLAQPQGAGTAVATLGKVFSQGELRTTDRTLDVAILGNGFFELLLPDGSRGYTRAGTLAIDADGFLVNPDGYLLSPEVQLPPDVSGVLFQADGTVLATVPDELEPIEFGRIELADFVNPAGLTPAGDNLYLPSRESGDAFYGEPGEASFGRLAQGFLEGSNVEISEELTTLITAQRGYEVNARILQAADEMLNIINNLRR